jgi:hypothetical protein
MQAMRIILALAIAAALTALVAAATVIFFGLSRRGAFDEDY